MVDRNWRRRAGVPVLAGAAMLLLAVPAARAQELEPRAYSPSPVGTNFFAVTAGTMNGDVLFDPSLPVTDVHADINMASLGYGRVFGLWGRQCLVGVGLPWSNAYVEGQVAEQARSVRRNGLADARVKFSITLAGAKAMTPMEFAKYRRRTIVGASLSVQAPTGQYDPTKLINLGTNRWAVKPEVGVSVPVGRWSLEAYAAAWFFASNDSFYPGASVRRQDPLTSLQAHLGYTLKNRAWWAIDSTWYGGGASTVDDGPPSARFSNTRIGGTFSFPVTTRQSIKAFVSRGATARTGSDFDQYLVGWQILWFDKPHPKAS